MKAQQLAANKRVKLVAPTNRKLGAQSIKNEISVITVRARPDHKNHFVDVCSSSGRGMGWSKSFGLI